MNNSHGLKNIIDALNLEELSSEDQEEILLDINDLIFKGTLVRMAESMDDATRESFEKLLDENASEEEIEAFIEKNVPEADKALSDTIEELTNDILQTTQE